MSRYNRLFKLAEHISTWSKDPNTKVGAVIADANAVIVGMGYNGFPRSVIDSEELYNDREAKYARVVHAELNAILNSTKSVQGCDLFVTLPPCNECAKVIIQAGIRSVHHYQSDRINKVSMQMFDEAGVEVIIYESPNSL